MCYETGFAMCEGCGVSDCDCEEKNYTVCAEITITVHVEVDSSSEEKAKEEAVGLIHNGAYEVKELVDEPKIQWAEIQD